MAEKKPKLSAARKRAIIAAALGIVMGVGCNLLPEHWRLPCALLVKLVALATGAP